jgi:hypothetical protein
MELVTNISMARQPVSKGQPSMFGPSKAIIDRAMRENADLKQKILRMSAEKEAAVKNTAIEQAALAAAREDLLAAQRAIASLRKQVESLTASLEEAKKDKRTKKDRKPEASAGFTGSDSSHA